MSAYRFTLLDAAASIEEHLFETLAGIPSSWTRDASGAVHVWVEESEAGAVRDALVAAGLPPASEGGEADRDWVAESDALRVPVRAGRYLLDPHEGERATAAPCRMRRLYLPAVRAFGTGSHESTRLALELLQLEDVKGRLVLDVGCGLGTLAFVAALEGASFVVALDLDPDAAFATRSLAGRNGISSCSVYAGSLDALGQNVRFDLVVANLLQEEAAPLLPRLRALLGGRGRLVSSGLLVSREEEWANLLNGSGFGIRRRAAEGEWLGTVAS